MKSSETDHAHNIMYPMSEKLAEIIRLNAASNLGSLNLCKFWIIHFLLSIFCKELISGILGMAFSCWLVHQLLVFVGLDKTVLLVISSLWGMLISWLSFDLFVDYIREKADLLANPAAEIVYESGTSD